MYQSLAKLYYRVDSKSYEQIYQARFNSPFTRHFDFNIRQFNYPKTHPAFFCYSEELVALIEKLYKLNTRFLSIAELIPPVVLYQFALSCILDEVKSTNDIEGIHSTRREIQDVVEEISSNLRFAGVVRKYNAILSEESFEFKSCDDIRRFYDEFVHDEVAQSDPSNRLDGILFRKASVDIASGTVGKILHRGVYPESEIIRSLDIALQILNDVDIPALVRIAVFHYLFSYIHPFYDGNGRTARFISSCYLANHIHRLASLRLSATIKRQQKKYYSMFSETDSDINRGDLTPFVIGFIEIIVDSIETAENILRRKDSQIKKYRQKLRDLILGDDLEFDIYDLLLQASLFYGQGITVPELMEITGKSRNTIMDRLHRIPAERLIVSKNKKHFYKLNLLFFNTKSSPISE